MNLIKNCKISVVLDTTAAGFGDTLSSDILDMTGFDGVLFIAKTGDVANTAVGTLTVQQDTDAAGGTMATLSGDTVKFTADATSADEKLLVIDLYKPIERYVRAQFQRETANIAVAGIIAIQYRSNYGPVTADAVVLDSALMVSPAQV